MSNSESTAVADAPVKRKPKDYKGPFSNIWCPGCGDFGVLSSLYMAFAQLQIDPAKVAIMSGIGCSSRLPGYVSTYGFNAVHGRSLPIASGLKASRPDLTVLAVGGDGDGFSIGSGHIPHAVRRNIDITYIVMDNQIYGLTKGQASPTTPFGDETKSTAYGNMDRPINPVLQMLSHGATFVARAFAMDAKHHAEMVRQALEHKGFAFVHSISPCTTFRDGKQGVAAQKARLHYLDETHDASDLATALTIARDADTINVGVIYREEHPTFTQRVDEIRKIATADGTHSVADVIDSFYP